MDSHNKTTSLTLEKDDNGVPIWKAEDGTVITQTDIMQKMLRRVTYPQRLIELKNQIKTPVEYLP